MRASTNGRAYDAVLIDLDGTLLDESGAVHPDNARALRGIEAAGGRVMIATGRSTVSARPVVEELGLATPAIVFNGAGLWCPVRRRMLEERILGTRTLQRALAYGARRDLLTVLMTNDRKYSTPPRADQEIHALRGLHGLEVRPRAELAAEFVMRVTFFSEEHATSADLFDEVEREVGWPVYLTHFPLNALPMHRESRMAVLDLHPPCRGKGEGLRALQDLYGIPPGRVVAIGDATNDIPMMEGAGLAVAMADGMPEALAAADRVIGDNDGTAIAELLAELFPGAD